MPRAGGGRLGGRDGGGRVPGAGCPGAGCRVPGAHAACCVPGRRVVARAGGSSMYAARWGVCVAVATRVVFGGRCGACCGRSCCGSPHRMRAVVAAGGRRCGRSSLLWCGRSCCGRSCCRWCGGRSCGCSRCARRRVRVGGRRGAACARGVPAPFSCPRSSHGPHPSHAPRPLPPDGLLRLEEEEPGPGDLLLVPEPDLEKRPRPRRTRPPRRRPRTRSWAPLRPGLRLGLDSAS